MAQRFCVGVCMLLALAVGGRSDDKPDSKVSAPAPHAGLEKLKKMVGTWVAADKDGKPTDQVVSVFKVTAAGSAVQETLFPGQPHEMISVYHLDGSDLVMTHYCMLGNQPRMRAAKDQKDLGADIVHVRAAPGDAEYFDAAMRAPLMKRIAEETGGRFFTPETAAALPEAISYRRCAHCSCSQTPSECG